MDYQPWRAYIPHQALQTHLQQQQLVSEDDKILCRALLKLLLEQKNKQECHVGKDLWFEFCSSVLGCPSNGESITQFLNRFPHIFAYTELINDAEVLIKSNINLALCKDHLSKEGCHNIYCSDLHCCKFYLHDTCKFRDNCSFGHDLKKGRNRQILESYMLSMSDNDADDTRLDYNQSFGGMTPKVRFGANRDNSRRMPPEITLVDLVQLLRQENPRVCKFYNSDVGCKHGADGRKCPALHLCRQYAMFGYCNDSYCNLCHDIRSAQPFSLLTRYGYDVSIANEQLILKQLQLEESSFNATSATPVKRLSPSMELQDAHYRHRYHPAQVNYGGPLDVCQDDGYNSVYYNTMDLYESDDAAWSSQDSRYCADMQLKYRMVANDTSDCEGVAADRSGVVTLQTHYTPVKTQMQSRAPLTNGACRVHPNMQQQYQLPSIQLPKPKEGDLKVCSYYNISRGCRYGEGGVADEGRAKASNRGAMGSPRTSAVCQNLHLCNHYIAGSCLYKNSGAASKCKRSHDLRSEHARSILEKHDIDTTCKDDETILSDIRRKLSQQVLEKDEVSASSSSSMERLSLDDLDAIDAGEVGKLISHKTIKRNDENYVLKLPCRINTFVFIDLEATGLDQPRITEISLVCLYRVDLEVSEQLLAAGECTTPRHEYSPRVINKLTLCVSPRKDIDPTVSAMTGLTNELLMYQKDFDHGLVDLLSEFLQRLPKPVCLVAHNGLRFDFPLLQAELVSIGRHGDLPSGLLCLDSLVMFRSLDESSRPTTKRPDVFRNLVASQPSITQVKKIIAPEPRTDWWGSSDDDDNTVTPTVASLGRNPTSATELKAETVIQPLAEVYRKKSYKLSEIHLRVTGEYPDGTHRAEDDSLALVRCFICTPGSLKWADENAMFFSGVTPMIIPRRRPLDPGVFPFL